MTRWRIGRIAVSGGAHRSPCPVERPQHPSIVVMAARRATVGDLLIRGLADETHEELKRRAQDAGVSLQTYVARLLECSSSVIDASATIDLLVRSGPGDRVRRWLADDTEAALITVAQLDAEVFSGLVRLHRAGQLEADKVDELLRRLARVEVRRVPNGGALLDAAWRMRDDIAARDTLEVAATRALGCALLTTDQRLARAVPDLALELNSEVAAPPDARGAARWHGATTPHRRQEELAR